MHTRAVTIALVVAAASSSALADSRKIVPPAKAADPAPKSDAFQLTVQCSLVYLSDMNDMKTLKAEDAGSLSVTSTTPVRGFAPLTKQSHGFSISVTLDPHVSDDTTFVHGFDVVIQLMKGEATSYGSTNANSAERFRRLSVIIGLGKEQVTANCDVAPRASKP